MGRCCFHWKTATLVLSRNADIDCVLRHNFQFFLINMVEIFIMSAELASLSLLKRKVFWNKGYDDTISVNNINNKVFSRDSNHIVRMVMWPMFSYCGISMREVITTSYLQGFDQKNPVFLRCALGSSSIIRDAH